jgi:hypothetical protein
MKMKTATLVPMKERERVYRRTLKHPALLLLLVPKTTKQHATRIANNLRMSASQLVSHLILTITRVYACDGLDLGATQLVAAPAGSPGKTATNRKAIVRWPVFVPQNAKDLVRKLARVQGMSPSDFVSEMIMASRLPVKRGGTAAWTPGVKY